MEDLPVITILFAATIILLQQCLMLAVGLHRVYSKIGIGTKGDPILLRKQRRHGNLTENSAVLITIIAILELLPIGIKVTIGFAILFLLGRICHALGFSFESGAMADKANLPAILRTIGAAATSFGGIAGALVILYSTLSAI